MRSRTSDWYETKIRYEKTMEDGMQKKITEQYVVDALSFTEAENSIIEEMSSYISGEFKITDIKHAAYHEIFFSDNMNDDKWYKTKLQFITIDEKSEKEKKTAAASLSGENSVLRIPTAANQAQASRFPHSISITASSIVQMMGQI